MPLGLLQRDEVTLDSFYLVLPESITEFIDYS